MVLAALIAFPIQQQEQIFLMWKTSSFWFLQLRKACFKILFKTWKAEDWLAFVLVYFAVEVDRKGTHRCVRKGIKACQKSWAKATLEFGHGRKFNKILWYFIVNSTFWLTQYSFQRFSAWANFAKVDIEFFITIPTVPIVSWSQSDLE